MARRAPSPVVAAVLSGVLPGLGQWYAGYRRRAAALLALAGIAAVPFVGAILILFFADGPDVAIDLARPFFDQPGYLLLLLVANAAILALRLAAALDAFWLAGGGFRRRWAIGVITSVIVLIGAVAAPHAWAARRNLALYDLLTYDYTGSAVSAGPSTTIPIPPTTTTTTIETTTSTAPPTTSTTSTSTTTTTLPPVTERRINLLLLGGDAGPDRSGLRTDTMIVVSVDPATGDTAMLQLPRNQVDLPIPDGHPAYNAFDCHCYPNLANTIYQYGLNNPTLFPGRANSGAQALVDLVGHLYGLPIQGYALVDLLGFVDVIDALGGLTITVTSPVTDEQYTRPGGAEVPVEYWPGTYEMDGEEVLAFARVRRGADDYHRMGRQRCVLEALAAQSNPGTLLRQLPYLVPATQGSIITDIPVRDWPDYIELLDLIDTTTIVSVRFMPNAPELAGTGTSYVVRNPQGYWIPNVDFIRQTVNRIITSEPTKASTDLDIEPLGEICGVSE